MAALTEEDWTAETGQIDSGYTKAHRSAGGAKGGESHAFVDVLGRPLRLVLTSDVKDTGPLIGETIGMKRMIADRGYDANRQGYLARAGNNLGAPWPAQSQAPYPDKDHWRIEAMFCHLKELGYARLRLPSHHHPPRQTRLELPVSHKPRRVPDLIGSEP